MDPYVWQLPALMAVGFVSGFLNILAGGGSLLTLPMLIFLGLPASVANGTNRIGVICQNIFAIASFRRHGALPLPLALICTAPALLGSYLGAQLAVEIDDQLFKRLLAAIMIGVLIITLLDPARRLRGRALSYTPLRLTALLGAFFLIGIYGGFVQAGVGFLIIPVMLLAGFDLVKTNAIKIFVVLVFTIPALAVFVWHGQVDWLLGFVLAAGNASGGWLASRMAVKKGHDWIKHVVTATVLIFALRLLLV
ncbi:MAG: sulfite exporter TauE/SafE family protein [Desulfuromonadales bacterium]|nr:sulfite exporter TauE/SafE family protein [Desulfuromonadales bacterium]